MIFTLVTRWCKLLHCELNLTAKNPSLGCSQSLSISHLLYMGVFLKVENGSDMTTFGKIMTHDEVI